MKRKFRNLLLTLLLAFLVFPKIGLYAFLFDNGSYAGNYDPNAVVSDLDELTPKTRELALKFLERCEEEGLKVRITETYRTQERQDKLYDQGRRTKGNVVTWTKNSKHTKRRAFDICEQGPNPYGNEDFFRRCAEIGREVGLTPGYYWEGVQDKPHYELNRWWLP